MSDKVKTIDEIQNQNDQNMLKFWQGTETEYGTIGDTNPDYLCFINGVGIKIGNKVIIKNNKKIDIGGTTDPSTLKFGDRIDNKATVVGTFDSSDLGTVVFAVLDSTYYGKTCFADALDYTESGLSMYSTEEEVLKAKESATYITDYIINNYGNYDIESLRLVRNIEPLKFNGKTYNCQVPNAYELQQIFNNRAKLYELDPTTETNTSYNLSEWNFDNQKYVLSSNEKSDSLVWVYNSNGSWDWILKRDDAGVCPIIEIPLK